MVTYEITAIVDIELAAEYEAYMTQCHIPDILSTGHFESVTFSRSGDQYRIRYEAHDQAALNRYLESDASRLRADFHDHFDAGVELSREVWDVVAEFYAP